MAATYLENLLTFWHSCKEENHYFSLFLKLAAPLLQLSIKFHVLYTRTFCSQASLFITISNYRYLKVLYWNTAEENSLSIDYNDGESGEWMALGYHSRLSTSSLNVSGFQNQSMWTKFYLLEMYLYFYEFHSGFSVKYISLRFCFDYRGQSFFSFLMLPVQTKP